MEILSSNDESECVGGSQCGCAGGCVGGCAGGSAGGWMCLGGISSLIHDISINIIMQGKKSKITRKTP